MGYEKKTFTFDLKRDLPIIAAAFVAGELAFQKDEVCSYLGPCALGACMTVEERAFFDHNVRVPGKNGILKESGTSAETLFKNEFFIALNPTERRFILEIQRLHDNGGENEASSMPLRILSFGDLLLMASNELRIDISAHLTQEVLDEMVRKANLKTKPL